ncbi:zeta toxin family protein [Pseudomonas sp. ANT_H12B]|uniref:zeta toxin family protein n=1 Tax=Pseudomonas sp. ANT_H12B TaxID=2597348 RepID=UPI0011F08867|nr:zeta toxin family protein [Pseudomonas sp. ANT_H12B]KAA0955013.1 Zeta toxin [Pseudomonas sp. ANT_H12B]
MSPAPFYAYTPEDVTAAFDDISPILFDGKTVESIPRLLITAGLQSSGKTYLLENSLLPSGRYSNHVRLYLPQYREKHPQYAEMIKLGVLHAYKHTEAFVRAVSGKVFEAALAGKFNIIMECAFDDIAFAELATFAAGYQLEAYVVGCNQAFAHLSSIKRALKNLDEKKLERFVSYSALQTSMNNAPQILLAMETLAKSVNGSRIVLFERGFGTLNERVVRAHSTYNQDANGKLTISATETPYTYSAYEAVINNQLSMSERDEIVKVCHLELLAIEPHALQVPDFVYSDLYAYIVKFAYR